MHTRSHLCDVTEPGGKPLDRVLYRNKHRKAGCVDERHDHRDRRGREDSSMRRHPRSSASRYRTPVSDDLWRYPRRGLLRFYCLLVRARLQLSSDAIEPMPPLRSERQIPRQMEDLRRNGSWLFWKNSAWRNLLSNHLNQLKRETEI